MNWKKILSWTAIVSVIVILAKVIVSYVLPALQHTKGGLWCIYGTKVYKVNEPKWSESQYHGLYAPGHAQGQGAFATIDDPVILSIAEQLHAQRGNLSDVKFVELLLAFVQQNTKYKGDISAFGVSDLWLFPVNTLRMRHGDCEDTTFLHAALCHLCGIDVMTIWITGHMLTGVCVKDGSGNSLRLNDRQYWLCETTGHMPNVGGGRMNSRTLYNYAKPTPPTEDWLNTLRSLEVE